MQQESDGVSRVDIEPRMWGPIFWELMHILSRMHNDGTWHEFLLQLFWFLPCSHCRKESISFLQSHPCSKDDMIEEWMWKFHNHVNEKLNKLCFERTWFDQKYNSWFKNRIHNIEVAYIDQQQNYYVYTQRLRFHILPSTKYIAEMSNTVGITNDNGQETKEESSRIIWEHLLWFTLDVIAASFTSGITTEILNKYEHLIQCFISFMPSIYQTAFKKSLEYAKKPIILQTCEALPTYLQKIRNSVEHFLTGSQLPIFQISFDECLKLYRHITPVYQMSNALLRRDQIFWILDDTSKFQIRVQNVKDQWLTKPWEVLTKPKDILIFEPYKMNIILLEACLLCVLILFVVLILR